MVYSDPEMPLPTSTACERAGFWARGPRRGQEVHSQPTLRQGDDPRPPGAERDHRPLKEDEEVEGGVRATSQKRLQPRGRPGHQPENTKGGHTPSLACEKGPAVPGLQLSGAQAERLTHGAKDAAESVRGHSGRQRRG